MTEAKVMVLEFYTSEQTQRDTLTLLLLGVHSMAFLVFSFKQNTLFAYLKTAYCLGGTLVLHFRTF